MKKESPPTRKEILGTLKKESELQMRGLFRRRLALPDREAHQLPPSAVAGGGPCLSRSMILRKPPEIYSSAASSSSGRLGGFPQRERERIQPQSAVRRGLVDARPTYLSFVDPSRFPDCLCSQRASAFSVHVLIVKSSPASSLSISVRISASVTRKNSLREFILFTCNSKSWLVDSMFENRCYFSVSINAATDQIRMGHWHSQVRRRGLEDQADGSGLFCKCLHQTPRYWK